MSLERVINALIDLGLQRVDAEIYVYLAKNGPLSVVDIAKKLKLKQNHLDRIFKNLQYRAIVKASEKSSIQFSAVPFEKVLNLLIEINKEQTEALDEIKKELLLTWRNISKKTSDDA